MTGDSRGIVILLRMWNLFAPSISAASMSSRGMFCNPARKITMPPPICQTNIEINDPIGDVDQQVQGEIAC